MSFSSHRTALIGLIALLLTVVTACASRAELALPESGRAQPAPLGTWHTDVRRMADADGNSGRRAHLRQRLGLAGMAVTTQPFASGELQGENLIADVGGPAAAPLLLIGAHSDRVDAGRGATDNASGSAAALTLAERFKRRPLAHHRMKVAFWDLEERGLLSASAYIGQDSERPALYINFDVFGWGDTLWMMSPDAKHPLALASRDAAQTRRISLTVGDRYPPSDHSPSSKPAGQRCPTRWSGLKKSPMSSAYTRAGSPRRCRR